MDLLEQVIPRLAEPVAVGKLRRRSGGGERRAEAGDVREQGVAQEAQGLERAGAGRGVAGGAGCIPACH
jgi:hypothetical protein